MENHLPHTCSGMDKNAPRSVRPTVRTGTTLKLSDETLAMPPIRISLGIGHIYRDKTDGSHWTLTGLRSGRTVILSSVTPSGGIRDNVPVDALADDYERVGCDHENHCCIQHRTHVMPHRGCMMR